MKLSWFKKSQMASLASLPALLALLAIAQGRNAIAQTEVPSVNVTSE